MQKNGSVRLEQEIDHKPNASRRGTHIAEHDHSLVAERHQNMTEIDILLQKKNQPTEFKPIHRLHRSWVQYPTGESSLRSTQPSEGSDKMSSSQTGMLRHTPAHKGTNKYRNGMCLNRR